MCVHVQKWIQTTDSVDCRLWGVFSHCLSQLQLLIRFGCFFHNNTAWVFHNSPTFCRSTARECGLWCTILQSQISLPLVLMTALVQCAIDYCIDCASYVIVSPSVRLWTNNRPMSIFSLQTRANVCSVKFKPTNRYHIAYGSAGKM